ncbi:MAG: molecular chaperone DnaJ [Cyanobium sp. NAT70]|nr:molecular chaperone DnaJ [Cyanobium sp. NAT70]|tara:strand:+ start:67 stop:648 length:582 start_codon:yes stop_codon:yes gene_type:complete
MKERMSQPLQISLSHYERLGVSSSADAETLRQAFRRRSKDLHPDTTMLPAEEAAIQFQLLRESYELLADPERRRVYDEQRTSASARPSQPTQRNDRDGWHGIGQRRPLSGGEWFSLLLLLLALLISLVFGLGVAFIQGREWQVSPGWLDLEQTQSAPSVPRRDDSSAIGSDPFKSAFFARVGALAPADGGSTL